MFEQLRDALVVTPAAPPVTVLVRLLVAMLFGLLVVRVYRLTRPASETAPSFSATLVLLAILIAMVTQVIGDNVARAFSLVGALSIVRFRTVVRDTQDTAYVIFAVGVGMAVGAGQYWVAVGGIVVIAMAAAAMRRKPRGPSTGGPAFELQARVGIGYEPGATLAPVLDRHVPDRRLLSMTTARQGLAVEVCYQITLADERAADGLIGLLNNVDGVQGVVLQRSGADDKDDSARRTR